MELFQTAGSAQSLTRGEMEAAVLRSLDGRDMRRALLIPPDFTRYHSNAGLLANLYYHALTGRGCRVDLLPALGTHAAVTREEASAMFGDIPFEAFHVHNWRTDVARIGEVPAAVLSQITGGLWNDAIEVEINRRVLDPGYDLILSLGQVVPHEVVGMANHAKNLFVGVGGSGMIQKSHMVGAVCGMERAMGRDHAPVREIFDYALEHFLKERPILFVLTVCTAKGDEINTRGLFIGDTRKTLEAAVALSQKENIEFVERGLKKCVVYLDPREFRSTWLGNKAIYRTRMAMADGGELLILAPGVSRFGEDGQVDRLIRKYGYCGTREILAQYSGPEGRELRENMAAAAHLIHGSSDGRFQITYAVRQISKEEITDVRFTPADYDAVAARYDPSKLRYGPQTMPDGEPIFFIPNPALGLWIDRERF